MLRLTPFANALAAVAALYYVLCAVLAAVSPDAYVTIARTWVHSMDVSVLYPQGMTSDIGSSILGLVTFTAAAWVTGALVAAIYNRQRGGQSS